MGKRREPRLFKITFGDGPYEGLSLTLRGLTIREYNRIGTRRAGDEDSALNGLVQTIAEQLVEWNREDADGRPLPPTLENLQDEEPALIYLLVDEWTQAMAGVAAPLDSSSPSGQPSEVESMLAEIPSQSLAS
ncbi:MAG: hypothetical protein HOY79_43105 [Streptomyces sp.]|nr:hypothetical protein [Streptomyces sp.]